MISIGAGFNSFLLFGLQHPRIFKISHSFSFKLIGMQFGLILSVLIFIPVSQVSRVSFFKLLYSFWCPTL